jgi:hypothetical protein
MTLSITPSSILSLERAMQSDRLPDRMPLFPDGFSPAEERVQQLFLERMIKAAEDLLAPGEDKERAIAVLAQVQAKLIRWSTASLEVVVFRMLSVHPFLTLKDKALQRRWIASLQERVAKTMQGSILFQPPGELLASKKQERALQSRERKVVKENLSLAKYYIMELAKIYLTRNKCLKTAQDKQWLYSILDGWQNNLFDETEKERLLCIIRNALARGVICLSDPALLACPALYQHGECIEGASSVYAHTFLFEELEAIWQRDPPDEAFDQYIYECAQFLCKEYLSGYASLSSTYRPDPAMLAIAMASHFTLPWEYWLEKIVQPQDPHEHLEDLFRLKEMLTSHHEMIKSVLYSRWIQRITHERAVEILTYFLWIDSEPIADRDTALIYIREYGVPRRFLDFSLLLYTKKRLLFS